MSNCECDETLQYFTDLTSLSLSSNAFMSLVAENLLSECHHDMLCHGRPAVIMQHGDTFRDASHRWSQLRWSAASQAADARDVGDVHSQHLMTLPPRMHTVGLHGSKCTRSISTRSCEDFRALTMSVPVLHPAQAGLDLCTVGWL